MAEERRDYIPRETHTFWLGKDADKNACRRCELMDERERESLAEFAAKQRAWAYELQGVILQ